MGPHELRMLFVVPVRVLGNPEAKERLVGHVFRNLLGSFRTATRRRIRYTVLMARPKVYVETSVISYLTSRPSRDVVVSAHQQITQEWWDKRRNAFHFLVSGACFLYHQLRRHQSTWRTQ